MDEPRFDTADVEDAIARAGLSEEEARFTRALARDGAAVLKLGDAALGLCDQAVADTDHLFEVGRVERVQDAWYRSRAIRELAAWPHLNRLLEAAWGRRPFPFQTLNFQRGSQQHLHSDILHFSSRPRGFMCGVWIALEDVRPESGPLIYVRGSHRLPGLTLQDCGVAAAQPTMEDYDRHYVPRFARLLADSGLPKQEVLIRKGEALVWSANLAHGGAPIADPAATRRSLVVHYYFDDCVYYTPRLSNEPAGRLALRLPADVRTGRFAWPREAGRRRPVPVRTVLGALKARILRRPSLG
jgi:ectoine hydroxylase-related dioxygenase (phytanoyl-CoA dioxygenase family)